MRLPNVIDAEIKDLLALRKRVPANNPGGMCNTDAIDAQVRVLRKDLVSTRDIEEEFLARRRRKNPNGPLSYEYELALSAYRWLYEVESAKPSIWWLEVIQRATVQQ
jgi:hypothetical protein